MAYNNIFLSGPDPLLGGGSPSTVDINGYIQELAAKQEMLEKQKQHLISQANNPQQVRTQAASPLWDEVDKEIGDLTDNEFQIMSESPEFQENQNAIMSVLNREYMRIMRPMVEQSKEGKSALENQLAFVKSFKKEAKDRAGEQSALMNDYLAHHSDIPFNQYMEEYAKPKQPKPKKQNRNGSKE